MKKLQITFLFFLIGMSLANSQEWEWVRQVSGTANDTGYSIDVDNEGNVFMAGRSKGTVTFENGGAPTIIPGFGYGDIFVSKYDKNGNLLWAHLAGSPDFGYDYAEDVVADGEGGCFITGFFLGEATFGEEIYTSNGNRDAFVAHLSSDGEFLWTKTFGGTSVDQGYGLTLDNEGNVLFCGLVTGEIEMDGEVMGVSGEYYGYVGKLNFDDGNLLDFHFFESSYKSNIYAVSVDDEDNIYLCGAIFGSATFNGVFLGTGHGPSRPDAFILKCDIDFNPIWFQPGGGNYYDQSFDLDVSTGAVLVAGTFAHDAVFDTISRSVGGGGVTLEEINGARNMYLASYDRYTGDIQWLLDAGYERADEIQGVKVGIDGDVYFSGTFRDSIAILDTVLYSGGLNSSQIVTGKLDPFGNLIWIRQSGNNSGNDSYGLSVDKYDNVFVSGSFSSVISFDGITLSAQERDAFGGKLTQHPNPEYILNDVAFCPGDTLVISLKGITSPLTYSYVAEDGFTSWMDSTNIYYLIDGGPEMTLNGTIYAANNIYIDSIIFDELITVFEVPVDLFPNDSLSCEPFALTIEADYDSYNWNDGAVFSNVLLIDSSGEYTILITTFDACTFRDTINILIPEEILLYLPLDTAACDSVFLTVPEGFESYNWNEGLDFDNEIRIDESGLYKIVVIDEFGCIVSDSVNVDVLEIISPNLMDTLSCGNLTYVVAGEYATYNWNDGADFDAEIDINESGFYTLFVTDENGCYGYDSMNVTIITIDVELPEDTVLCDYYSYLIVVPDIYESYSWSTGDEDVSEVTVYATGDYYITVTDEYGCEDSDTIHVEFTDCTSISENDSEEQKIFYNFQNNSVYNTSTESIEDILILSISGKEVQRIEILNPNEEVSLLNLSTGIYYVVYWDENKSISRTKIMTIH